MEAGIEAKYPSCSSINYRDYGQKRDNRKDARIQVHNSRANNNELEFSILPLLGRSRCLNFWKIADHVEQVHQPECQPNRCRYKKLNQNEDQTGCEEHHSVSQKPEAVGSPGAKQPLGFIYPVAERAAVIMQRREHQ